MEKIKKSLKTGDRVTVQLPMDHHHGRKGAVEAVNEGMTAVKFDDNARSFYKESELNLDQPMEDPNVDKAYGCCEKACLIYQLAAMAQDAEAKQDLLEWASDLEEKCLMTASLVTDASVMNECRQIIQSCKPSNVAKGQPTSSDVHVSVPMGGEKKIKKEKAHDTSNLEKLKSALKALQESLDSFLSEEEQEDVGKDATADPEQEEETAGEYKDPDTNANMYPELDNLEVEILKDAFNANISEDDNNNWDGIYDMQQVVEGMDWELEHTTTDPTEAQNTAVEQLQQDPNHYKLLRAQTDGSDDALTKAKKDTSQTEEDPFAGEGYNLDLGSGPARQGGHLGLDVYPYDHGTVIHDLNTGIPFPSGSVSNVRAINSLHEMDDPKALLSEIHRVMMPGGNFVYEGPNEIYNYPEWESDYPGFVLTDHQDGNEIVDKDTSGSTAPRPVRQVFTRVATPDPATANDAEPRIGAAQYDQLPADALLAADAVGYAWSDSTSSGRGNRLMGYPSQGAILDKASDSSGSGDSNQEVKQLRFFKDENFNAEDDVNPETAPMTPAEEQVDDALHPNAVNPLPPKKPSRGGSKKSKRQKSRAKKGGPGSGPNPGGGLNALNHTPSPSNTGQNARHAAQISHDRKENERKQQRIREQAQRNVQAYHRQASYDSHSMTKSKIAKALQEERIIPILKADMHKQIVYGVVLAPNEIDAQDDFMTDDDIESTAHNYLTHSRVVGAGHTRPIEDAYPVESFIAPQDFEMNGQYGLQPVKKGSWVLGVKIKDPDEWQKVLDGEYTGFSVGGIGERQQT